MLHDRLKQKIVNQIEATDKKRQEKIKAMYGIKHTEVDHLDLVIAFIRFTIREVGKIYNEQDSAHPILTQKDVLPFLRPRFSSVKMDEEEKEELISRINDATQTVIDSIPKDLNQLPANLTEIDKEARVRISNKIGKILNYIEMVYSQEDLVSFLNTDCVYDNAIYNKVAASISHKIKPSNLSSAEYSQIIMDDLKKDVLEKLGKIIFDWVDIEPVHDRTFSNIYKNNLLGKMLTTLSRGLDKILLDKNIDQELKEFKTLLYGALEESEKLPQDFDERWGNFEKKLLSPDFQNEIIQEFLLALRDKVYSSVAIEDYQEKQENMHFPNIVAYKGLGYWAKMGSDKTVNSPEEIIAKGILPKENEYALLRLSGNSYYGNSHSPSLASACRFATYWQSSGWVVLDVISKGINVIENAYGRSDEQEISVPYILPEQIIGLMKIEKETIDGETNFYLTDYVENAEFDLSYSYDETYKELKKAIDCLKEKKAKNEKCYVRITPILERYFNVNPDGSKKSSSIYDYFHQKELMGTKNSAESSVQQTKTVNSTNARFFYPIIQAEEDKQFRETKLQNATIQQHAEYIINKYYRTANPPSTNLFQSRILCKNVKIYD